MAHQPESPPPSAVQSLVGRDREQSILRAALAAAFAGRGSLVLIGGEAGIGKTTLSEALLNEAAGRGALTLVGRCYDLAETPPYGPWIEALVQLPGTDILPTPLGAGDPAGSQAALIAQIQAVLTNIAVRAPLVLLLEDLHWSDPGSLDVLRYIARQLGALPMLILATYRDDELVAGQPLAAILPLLVREARAARLVPSHLTAKHARDFVRSHYRLRPSDEDRLVAHLHAHAEGNPFYLNELLRALEEEGLLHTPHADTVWALGDLGGLRVPPLLRQVIGARVARLGAAAGRLLPVAAVIGQVVPVDLWAVVGEADDQTLSEAVGQAVAARILAETTDGHGVRFAHALVRAALYEATPLPRRRILHRRAAEALLATPTPASEYPDPDAVAGHLQRAGDPRAAAWLIRAGVRAWRSYAWLTAADRYEAALALTEHVGMDPGERARLLQMLAQFWRYEDRHRGLAHLDEAERLALAAGDDALVAAVRFDRGHLRLLTSDVRAVAERPLGLAEMIAALPALEAQLPAARAQLPALVLQGVGGEELYHRGALMYWLVWVGRLAEAIALAAPMTGRVSGTTARGLAALGVAYTYRGQPEEADRVLDQAEAAFRAAGQQTEVYFRLVDRLQVAYTYHFDRPERWRPLLVELEETARRAASVGRIEPNTIHLQILLACGDWDAVCQHNAEHSDDVGQFLPIVWHQGDTNKLLTALDRSLPRGSATEPGGHPLLPTLSWQQLAASAALARGDMPTARAWLVAHDRWLTWSGAALGRAEGELGWAAYHRAAGDLSAARDHAGRALVHASEPRQPLALLATHRALGEIATAAGGFEEALDHLDAALSLAEACATPYERALTLLALAELHLATGQRDAAETALIEARTMLVRLQARPALARCDALIARLHDSATVETIPGASPTAPGGLTSREVEVLRLVAAGRSNREMAEALSRSERTIERHLENIYRKIDARNRAEATAFALRHRLA